MCGRYALALPPSRARQRLRDSNMPSHSGPDDSSVRQAYNFAPGYFGLVYRADVPDHGAVGSQRENHQAESPESAQPPEQLVEHVQEDTSNASEPVYKLQAMKWGLVPFWTKRNPDYSSLMKTINARDDSLAVNTGMWNAIKRKKRCVVIAEGFFEWLKKDDSKHKIPHYMKRKDGQLMCFAGLWDCAKFEDAEDNLYTYTIITTDSNKQLNFLHDRMPVILDNGSDDMFRWLDPQNTEWTAELQNLLKPYDGELECYPVTQDVGKVGNNSPAMVVPVDSSENKQNIANFFGSQKKSPEANNEKNQKAKEVKSSLGRLEDDNLWRKGKTLDYQKPVELDNGDSTASNKRTLDESSDSNQNNESATKTQKLDPPKKTRSAISNSPIKKVKSPIKAADGSKKITSFFSNK